MAIAILKLCTVEWSDLAVHALYDGDEVDCSSGAQIEGAYDAFAHLETLPRRAVPPDPGRHQHRRVVRPRDPRK